MTKILIVEDEQDYRQQLETALSWDQGEVRSAGTGRTAIDLGSRYRPDLLITDWMLKDHIHGLHVAQVLQVVCPDMKTILITGFPSDDLRETVHQGVLSSLLEKPFELDHIRQEIQNVLAHDTFGRRVPSLGVIELDPGWNIVYANPKAREMLNQLDADGKGENLNEFFEPGQTPDLDEAAHRWIVANPINQRATWHMRSQIPRLNSNRIAVIMPAKGPLYLSRQLAHLLLDCDQNSDVSWPARYRALVVEGEAIQRRFVVSQFEAIGATCYAVATPNEASRLFEEDDGINIVILDHTPCGRELDRIVKGFRNSRHGVQLVGMGEADYRNEFAEAGISGFLMKPWRIVDLLNVIDR